MRPRQATYGPDISIQHFSQAASSLFPSLTIIIFSDGLCKKKVEAKSKERRVQSTSKTDTAQDSGYHSGGTKEFPTIEELVVEKDESGVLGVGHARPFPFVSQVSSKKKLVIYRREHVAPHLSKILAAHKIPGTPFHYTDGCRREAAIDQIKSMISGAC